MKISLYLDRQSENYYRTYRAYVRMGDQTERFAGKVIQIGHGMNWYSGEADRHDDGHRTRAQAVHCLLRRVTQARLETAR